MNRATHENLEGLRRLFSGQGAAPPGEIERVAAHLTGCRPCWFLAARALAAQKASGGLILSGGLRAVADLQKMERTRLEEWLEAQASWAEIRPLGTKARRDKVRLTRSMHTLVFVEVLCGEGATGGVSPADSEELFYLALLVAAQLPSPAFSVEVKNDICAECCAEIANARRRLAKWPAARDALQKASQYAEKGKRDGAVQGRVLHVMANLEADLGNRVEAGSLLRQAIELFEGASQPFLKSKALAKLAYLLVDTEPAESLRIIDRCLALLPPENPRLTVFAESIKIDCLMGLGAPEEALFRFHGLTGLYEQFREPFIQLRRRFTAGRLLEHLGRPHKAEPLFKDVIAADLEHGLVKDLFLDLAYLFGFYLRAKRLPDAIAVCQRASQELTLLDGEEGSGEAARDQMRLVWRRLEEGVRRGTVALGATTVLRSYIQAHWKRPANALPSFEK
jgi:tetratricopeptide (TPR) repeat protein